MGNLRAAGMAVAVAGAWLIVGHGAALGVDEPEPSPAPGCDSGCEATPDPTAVVTGDEPTDASEDGPVVEASAGGPAAPSGNQASSAVAPDDTRASPTGATAVSARSARARADAAVSIVDNDYEPRSVTITEGDSVTWTHEGAQPHTVTANDGSFDSGNMTSGDTFSHTFPSAGTFPYFCEVHGQSMSGSVTVEAAATGDGEGSDDTDGGANEGAGDEAGSTEIADQGLPATGRDPGAWVAIGAGLILCGALTWHVGRRGDARV